MIQQQLARAWLPWRLRWLEWLDRIDSAGGRHASAFERQRRRMLLLAHALLLGLTLPWAIYFLLQARLALAAFDGLLLLSATATFSMLRRGQVGRASLLHLLTCLLAVAGLAVVVDTPTLAAPRSLQLYLVPLAMVAYFVLQHDYPRMRYGMPALIAATFCLLASSGSDFGFPAVVPEPLRVRQGWINGGMAALAFYLVLTLMIREARASTALQLDFARAIEAGELEFHLQPQCAASGSIVGAEALMRWRHPRRGLVAPGEFIPMAERSGLIVPAGEQLLRAVCAALARWRDTPGLRGLPVAVNLAPRQLSDRAAMQRLFEIIDTALPEAPQLKLELTESALVSETEAVHWAMAEARRRGIRISLDDFGTGFSSLSYLKKLPLDQLKIDQSFVRDLPGDLRALRITRTVIALGRELGLEIIAEGVETRAQAQALAQMGCGLYQGYHFGRPLPLAGFEQMALAAQAGERVVAAGHP